MHRQRSLHIISSLPNAPEGALVDVSPETREDLSVNDEGEVELSNEVVIGTAQDVFGDKIYSDISETLERKTEEILAAPESTEDQQISHFAGRIPQGACCTCDAGNERAPMVPT